MKARRQSDLDIISVVPVNEGTRAMLDYADSPVGREKIAQARAEIAQGKGIVVTPEYRDDLNRRVSARVAKERRKAE